MFVFLSFEVMFDCYPLSFLSLIKICKKMINSACNLFRKQQRIKQKIIFSLAAKMTYSFRNVRNRENVVKVGTMRDMESWAVCYCHFKKCQCKCTFTVIIIDIFKKTVNLVMSS
jgi:hypothetical protein